MARQVAASVPSSGPAAASTSCPINPFHSGYSGADTPAPRNATAVPAARYSRSAAIPPAFTRASSARWAAGSPAR